MTIHCSGTTVEAQERLASGVEEILRAHLAGRELPAEYLLVDASAR